MPSRRAHPAQSVYPRRTLPAVLTSTATLFALSRNRTHQPKPDTPQIPHESHTPAAPVFSPRILPPRPIPPPRPPSAGMRIRNIDKKASLCYNTERADKSALARRSHNTDGIWCNGNTRDFDSRFAGSSPAIPAMMTSQFRSERRKEPFGNPSGGKTGDFERFLPFFRPCIFSEFHRFLLPFSMLCPDSDSRKGLFASSPKQSVLRRASDLRRRRTAQKVLRSKKPRDVKRFRIDLNRRI